MAPDSVRETLELLRETSNPNSKSPAESDAIFQSIADQNWTIEVVAERRENFSIPPPSLAETSLNIPPKSTTFLRKSKLLPRIVQLDGEDESTSSMPSTSKSSARRSPRVLPNSDND